MSSTVCFNVSKFNADFSRIIVKSFENFSVPPHHLVEPKRRDNGNVSENVRVSNFIIKIIHVKYLPIFFSAVSSSRRISLSLSSTRRSKVIRITTYTARNKLFLFTKSHKNFLQPGFQSLSSKLLIQLLHSRLL